MTELCQTIESLRESKLTQTELTKQLQKNGYNKLYFALDPKYIPDVDTILDRPPDIMHIYGCGITRHEGGKLFKILFESNPP